MTLTEITKKLLNKGENLNIEYKKSISQELNDILVAFANGDGGICLLGVEDDTNGEGKHIGKIVGIEISDRTRSQIQSRADQTNDRIKIKIETEYDDDEKGIYIVTVYKGINKPYSTGGGRYIIRHNGQNCPITPNMMEELIEHRIDTSPLSQPIIRIRPEDPSIHPSILFLDEKRPIEEFLERGKRHQINIPLNITNIGDVPAQDIILDAEVTFVRRRPLKQQSLPIHLYHFIDFIHPYSLDKDRDAHKYSIHFDMFVAREIILDFFENRKHFKGGAFLANHIELQNRDIWPSPLITFRVLYSDIHRQNYCSERQYFFHMHGEKDTKILKMYFLDYHEFGFRGIRKISKQFREEYSYERRHLRYGAFDGKVYPKDALQLLSVVWKESE